ncbi:MAG: hypothetical protein FH753_12560 [Firmicutes bacterium]|nr:hypothetical protein [Bacillota bacterium]
MKKKGNEVYFKDHYRLKEFDEYIFSPLDTNVFLKINEKDKTKLSHLRNDILKELNNECNSYDEYTIKWGVEDNKKYKLAKGVFIPPGKDKSFVKGIVKTNNTISYNYPLDTDSEVNNIQCKVEKIVFYIYEYGIGTISMKVNVSADKSITVEQMDQVSEFINNKFRKTLSNLCIFVRDTFKRITSNKEAALSLELFKRNNRKLSRDCIPWTHRIYHINDNELLTSDKPGEFFRFLVTPSSQVDIHDFSIYDHRYIYFGWGHSIIITDEYDDGYEQTTVNIDYYIRLVEIAQAKWQCLNKVNSMVDSELLYFNSRFEDIKLKHIEQTIYEIQLFNTNINSILRSLDDLKITFDTEKRNLLKELNDRWHVDTLKENLLSSMDEIEKKLMYLRDRKISINDGRLNSILFILTIISSIEVFVTIYNLIWADNTKAIVSEAVFTFSSTITLLIFIIFYINRRKI